MLLDHEVLFGAVKSISGSLFTMDEEVRKPESGRARTWSAMRWGGAGRERRYGRTCGEVRKVVDVVPSAALPPSSHLRTARAIW